MRVLYGHPREKLDDGWPESVEEHSERYKYEDLVAWNVNIEIYDDAWNEKTWRRRVVKSRYV